MKYRGDSSELLKDTLSNWWMLNVNINMNTKQTNMNTKQINEYKSNMNTKQT